MNSTTPAHPGRGLAAGLAGAAALAAVVLLFTDTWVMWAWRINEHASATALAVAFLAGALLLGAAAFVGTAGAMRLAFATMLVFSGIALWVTFGHHLVGDTSPGIPKSVAFLWEAILIVGVLGSAVQLITAGRRGPRTPNAELPLVLVAPALIPGVLFGYAGLKLLSGPESAHSFIPWQAQPNDLRLFGAVLVAVAVGSLMAILERDANSIAGGAFGAGALGIGMLVVAAQDRHTFGWQTADGIRYLVAAGVLMVLGAIGTTLHAVMPNAQRWEAFVRADHGPRSTKVGAAADAGFFGPDSVAWRVWSYPTSPVMGFQRAVGIEELDPFLVAAVDATKRIREYPAKRYDYTLLYFATVAFGDTRSVVKASQALTRMHARNTGTEPLSGKPFDANNPDSQLWILVTGWHSVLKAYEMYGPGPLTEADEAEWWAACALAAEFQTCDPAAVPRNRAELRAYYARVNPGLVASPVAVDTFEYLLNPINLMPDLPAILRPGAKVINAIGRAAVIATLPTWMRQQTGINQPAWVDKAVAPWIRMSFGFVSRLPWLEIQILKLISPSTIKVVEPVLYGVHPSRTQVSSPAAAFAAHDVPTPAAIIAGNDRQEA
ncbi:hypothetical protein Back2_16190 [Nocardioides baekrokdamisoli]|uniref:ER-bound oxygenase mpaB/mpaB'/Rubber oxygenase catalytic domain-containing protein n=1 Tax=Nocardioides baekrokdamisoli TaxID=1804624 RepID=A0A3G9IGD7_9ACTN|nr:oxygenase MpaB family protein [Nocardioides baekrokdamisoli]BBH17332.1 hypothetical protein Back2_16190 [Nocardioides baekrokdamisoli]